VKNNLIFLYKIIRIGFCNISPQGGHFSKEKRMLGEKISARKYSAESKSFHPIMHFFIATKLVHSFIPISLHYVFNPTK
jgi:hypothetical protein